MGRGLPTCEARTATDVVTCESPRLTFCGGLATPQEKPFALSSEGNRNRNRKKKNRRRVGGFASWNVRSLVENDGGIETARQEGSTEVVEDRKIETVVRQFKHHGIEAAGLQETKWFGVGIYSVSDATVLSSGRPIPQCAKVRREGVAIVLRGRMLQAWRDSGSQWCAHSSRLISAKLKIGTTWIHVASCYAPTFAARREEKDRFYDDLRQYVLSIDDKDQFVILGDFNARVGTSRGEQSDFWKPVRGPHGYGALNDAGEELLTFLSLVGGTICNTWFQHQDIHKATWSHPRSGRWHCIDFVITRQRDLKLCQDVRVVRGAECATDHLMLGLRYLLPTTARQHHCKVVKRRRFDVDKLYMAHEAIDKRTDSSIQSPSDLVSEDKVIRNAEVFSSRAVSNIQSAWCEGNSASEKWRVLRSAITTAAEDTLGFQRRRRPDWYQDSMDILDPVLERRNRLFRLWLDAKTSVAREAYCHARGLARAAVRAAKNNWFCRMASVVEKGRFGEKEVWNSIRAMQTCRKGLVVRSSASVKDKEGNMCTSAEAQHSRWREHFMKILNVKSMFDQSELNNVRQREIQDHLNEKPSLEELSGAVRRMSRGKAGGCSGILPELLKASSGPLLHYILNLVHTAWDERRVPQDWVDADIVPVPKKGDLTSCDNWRGIALLDVVGKMVGKIIQTRLQHLGENELPEEQCGFRKNRSCTDMSFVVRQITEKCYEHRRKAYLVFVDLRKAYDSVPRAALWIVLRKLGVPENLVQLIESFHADMSARVLVDGVGLDDIEVNNGLRQGCSMAPVLFNLYACALMERWLDRLGECADAGVHLSSVMDKRLFRRTTAQSVDVPVSNGQFADDAVLIASTHDGAEHMLDIFAHVAADFGLRVSVEKTKIQAVGYDLTENDRAPLVLYGLPIDHASEFRYLGSVMTSDGRSSTDVCQRIAAASRAFGSLFKPVFRDRSLTIRTKRLLYTSCVLSVLLYGSETWSPLQRDLKKLEQFHHHCLAAILNVSRTIRWQNHISNLALRQQWGELATISQMITCRRFEWLGHVARMPSYRLPQQVLFSWFPKTRPFCGPRRRWKDVISNDFKRWSMPVSNSTWFDLACNRSEWAGMYKSAIFQAGEDDVPCPGFPCDECGREFRSNAGFKRHKCLAERLLPLHEQPGSVNCHHCGRWFASAGGFAVHKCDPAPPANTESSQHAVTSSAADRTVLRGRGCCKFHCAVCDRCLKSSAGFQRHNCDRLRHRTVLDRSSFHHQCTSCSRHFRRKQDLSRHKC